MLFQYILLYLILCTNQISFQFEGPEDTAALSFNGKNIRNFAIPTNGAIIFPDAIYGPSISEQKCEEYKKQINKDVLGLPLISIAKPVRIEIAKCDYNSLPLIVGGTPARVSEFPHMAAIGFSNENNDIEWYCGGTLISDYYVLTAAHCTSTLSGRSPTVVRLGELNLKSDNDGTDPKDYYIAKITLHPDYRPPQSYNDIALLLLSRKVKFNNFIRPACLWNKNQITYSKALATGWGKIDNAEEPSDWLLKVSLDIIDYNTCKEKYSMQRIIPQGLSSSMICAGKIEGRKDTCQGDSGGPLVITKPGNHCIFYIIGITSFGIGCGNNHSPGVYTKVSSFIPWIENIVWN